MRYSSYMRIPNKALHWTILLLGISAFASDRAWGFTKPVEGFARKQCCGTPQPNPSLQRTIKS